MIWTDGRARKQAGRDARWHHKVNWHRRFAWWPVQLHDPPSRTLWLAWYEQRYMMAITHYVWRRRALGSNFAGW